MTPALINKAQRMYNARQFTMAEIAQSCDVTPMTISATSPPTRPLRTEAHSGTRRRASPRHTSFTEASRTTKSCLSGGSVFYAADGCGPLNQLDHDTVGIGDLEQPLAPLFLAQSHGDGHAFLA